ncbi:unnamed protein product, partial [Ectocarpus fasciculatus]
HSLVRHKVHALTHPELEMPLLLAAALIVQAAQAVARAHLCTPVAAPTTSPSSPNSDAAAPPLPSAAPALRESGIEERRPDPPLATTVPATAAAALNKRGAAGGHGGSITAAVCGTGSGSSPAGRANGIVGGGGGEDKGNDQPSAPCGPTSGAVLEAAAAREITEAFPRGWLADVPDPAAAAAAVAIRESWSMLVEALESKVVPGKTGVGAEAVTAPGEEGGEPGGSVSIDPGRFPLLLSRRFHEGVVRGLAANLLEVEVESPVVEYCEALVTRGVDVQRRALEVLEPALNDMEDESDFPYSDEISSTSSNGVESDAESERDGSIDSSGGRASATSRSNTENKAKKFSGNCSENLPENLPVNLPVNLPENLPESRRSENRSRERLAWRCVQAARSASRLLPRLTAHALLPASALRLAHSCAPAVRVPAGDRRSYNAAGGGGGGVVSGAPTAGAAGWPLTVATVALRDLAAGEPLSCSWVDPEEAFSVRMARLEEYARVPPDPSDDGDVPPIGDCAASCGPLRCGVGGGDGGDCRGSMETGEGKLAQLHSPGGRGCGCPKCLVESGGLDGGGSEGVSGAGAAERLLKAAQQAVDEDRFDDAFEALTRAGRHAPDNADILYRAGVCAINQGRWSRALRLWRDGLALSPDHPELKQEAEKYQALAFWLDPGKRDTNTNTSSAIVGAAADSGSAAASSPPFSSPPPLTAGGQNDGVTPPALLPAGEAFDNLDVDFMAGDGEWVCSTRLPLLSASECSAIVNEAEEKASAAVAAAAGSGSGGSGGWGTSRHYAVPTTDVAVRELPRTLAWFNRAMRTRVGPTVAVAAALGGGVFEKPGRRCSSSLERSPPVAEPHAQDEDYPAHAVCSAADSDEAAAAALAATALVEPQDGQEGERRQTESDDDQEGNGREAEELRGRAAAATPPPPELLLLRRLRVHDAFVVRYDAAAQRSLPLHTDQGELSLTISLNSAGEYEGGGTWFEGLGRAVRPEEAGHVVVFPGGRTVHGGREVTRGVRYILAVFLYEHWEEEEEEE